MVDRFFFDARHPEQCVAHLRPLFNAILAEDPVPCALICAAYIDNCLKGLLERAFWASGTAQNSNTAKQILGMNGFLGPTLNRAKLAYCLSLIKTRTLENIEAIARIRNEFAHSPAPIDFSHPNVKKLCDDLKGVGKVEFPPYLLAAVFEVFQAQNNPQTTQQRFVEVALGTALTMITIPGKISEVKSDPQQHDSDAPTTED